MSVSTSTGTASIPSTAKERARTSKGENLLDGVQSDPVDRIDREGDSNRRAGKGLRRPGGGDRAPEPVRQEERLLPRIRRKRCRAEAVPVVQAEEACGVRRKVGTRPDRGGQRFLEGLPRGTPEPLPVETPDESRVRAGERREAERDSFSRGVPPLPMKPVEQVERRSGEKRPAGGAPRGAADPGPSPKPEGRTGPAERANALSHRVGLHSHGVVDHVLVPSLA